MKAIFRFFVFHVLYWILVGWWARMLFILYHSASIPFKGSDWVSTFIHGFRLDLSLSCYITAVVLIFGLGFEWSAHRLFNTFLKFWQGMALLLYLLITMADIVVYNHWATKLNLTALSFARHPAEVFASIGSGDHLLIIVITFLISFVVWWRVYLLMDKRLQINGGVAFRQRLVASLIYLGSLGLCIIGMRGGLQLEPINQSAAYFSERPIYNHTAINATWNLMNKIVNNHGGANPYHFGTEDEVNNILDKFYQKDTTEIILNKVSRPNIVFIILEGFTADVISAFGGEPGLTPTIDSLIGQGLIWPQFYANGDRTYKGLPSLLNGIPTRPVGSIIQNNDLTNQIPSISKSLKSRGYTSSFYYGGESEFANIKSYLINTGFEKIIDIKDFPSSYRGIKWGVPDHYVFDRMVADLNQASQPFLSCILTLSSHEPYDIPIPPLIDSKTWPDLFRNTVYYTDQSLGKFLQIAKGQSWYDSTLFILTADHGNPMPKEYPNNFDPGKFKIPLLMFGSALPDDLKGRRMNKTGSHTDLVYSLLTAMQFSDTALVPYRYAQQLFDQQQDGHVLYTFDQGFGIINGQAKMAYDLTGGQTVFSEGPVSDSLIRLGKLLMQGTYDPHRYMKVDIH